MERKKEVIDLDILTSNLYGEVGSFFSISHKVDLYIRQKLNQSVKPLIDANSSEKGMKFINLIFSTNKSTDYSLNQMISLKKIIMGM
jgi:hypothetical protein